MVHLADLDAATALLGAGDPFFDRFESGVVEEVHVQVQRHLRAGWHRLGECLDELGNREEGQRALDGDVMAVAMLLDLDGDVALSARCQRYGYGDAGEYSLQQSEGHDAEHRDHVGR